MELSPTVEVRLRSVRLCEFELYFPDEVFWRVCLIVAHEVEERQQICVQIAIKEELDPLFCLECVVTFINSIRGVILKEL